MTEREKEKDKVCKEVKRASCELPTVFYLTIAVNKMFLTWRLIRFHSLGWTARRGGKKREEKIIKKTKFTFPEENVFCSKHLHCTQ